MSIVAKILDDLFKSLSKISASLMPFFLSCLILIKFIDDNEVSAPENKPDNESKTINTASLKIIE
jgi:hypothetical protein